LDDFRRTKQILWDKLNTKAKGSRYELKLKKEFEERGYPVEKAIHTKSHQDFYGVADLLVLSPKALLMVQVTTIGHKAEHLKKMLAFNEPSYALQELWCYTDGQPGWRIFTKEGIEL
jgi:hypothetical protein